MAYRVPDLDAGERINCLVANPDWQSRFAYAMEASLAPMAGLNVTLIQLDPAN